ncbi:AN1-type zinc finger protein 2A-like isoform X2 [Eulemur rufifrons]|uniref:AN1-type zinc finger protein 2A-like isoform X2 n=1 Tax=Eulemur rufifrons TaxID=859984 RepID=UPI003743EBBF
MEFPDLGKYCSEKTCKQLDFLPLKCGACKQDFCKDHFTCAAHRCPFAFMKDVHVPVCPLCNVPIPVKKGEIPDVVVGNHMDRDCKLQPGRSKKKHRHPLDHSCTHGSRLTSKSWVRRDSQSRLGWLEHIVT